MSGFSQEAIADVLERLRIVEERATRQASYLERGARADAQEVAEAAGDAELLIRSLLPSSTLAPSEPAGGADAWMVEERWGGPWYRVAVVSNEAAARGLLPGEKLEGPVRRAVPLYRHAPASEPSERLREARLTALELALDSIAHEDCDCVTDSGPDDHTCPACIATEALNGADRVGGNLLRELEEVGEDTARLEWLEQHGDFLNIVSKGIAPWCKVYVTDEQGAEHEGNSIREAIDNARLSTPTPEPEEAT